MRLETFIPFADLLPHVDVVVTNGGYGGTQQALAHGDPGAGRRRHRGQERGRGSRRWSGAGIDLRTQTPTAAQVGDAVQTVLADPSYRRRARELQARYAERDAPGTAADLVEGLLRGPTADA